MMVDCSRINHQDHVLFSAAILRRAWQGQTKQKKTLTRYQNNNKQQQQQEQEPGIPNSGK
jgi:hypothetical protein